MTWDEEPLRPEQAAPEGETDSRQAVWKPGGRPPDSYEYELQIGHTPRCVKFEL